MQIDIKTSNVKPIRNTYKGTVANRDLSRRFPFTKVLRDQKLYSLDTLHPEVDHNKMMRY